MTNATPRQARVRELFAAIDAMDMPAFLGHLAPEASFRFGSAPAVTGREAIGAAVGEFFSTIAGLSHELTLMLEQGDTLVCEGKVTYTRADGSTVTLPFADVFDYEGELIGAYKIYADISPLYAA